MRMFDSPVAHIVITFLSSVVAAVNLFGIYAIWKHSPKTMGTFKLYILRMATVDLIFASCTAFLFLPNLVFPLPAAIVAGLLRYFGRSGAIAAYTITVAAGGMMMLAVNSCCLYRIFVFYKMDRWVEFLSSKKALLHAGVDFLIFASFIGGISYAFQATYEELQAYAQRHGLEELMANIHPDTPIIAFDMDLPIVIFGMVIIALFLLATGGFNVLSNYKVYQKIMENKRSMSKETYKMQKSLTLILLAQTIIPGISIAIPVVIYQIALYLSLQSVLQSPILEWFIVLIIGAYPFVNSCFCLYSMPPYRRFTKSFGKGVLFCVHWREEEVTILDPSGTSSNL